MRGASVSLQRLPLFNRRVNKKASVDSLPKPEPSAKSSLKLAAKLTAKLSGKPDSNPDDKSDAKSEHDPPQGSSLPPALVPATPTAVNENDPTKNDPSPQPTLPLPPPKDSESSHTRENRIKTIRASVDSVVLTPGAKFVLISQEWWDRFLDKSSPVCPIEGPELLAEAPNSGSDTFYSADGGSEDMSTSTSSESFSAATIDSGETAATSAGEDPRPVPLKTAEAVKPESVKPEASVSKGSNFASPRRSFIRKSKKSAENNPPPCSSDELSYIDIGSVVSLPQDAYTQLSRWYGAVASPVVRSVVDCDGAKPELEINRPQAHLVGLGDVMVHSPTMSISASDPLQVILDSLSSLGTIRLWRCQGSLGSQADKGTVSYSEFRRLEGVELVETPASSWRSLGFGPRETLVVEKKLALGWYSAQSGRVKGTTGFKNLGNTCYMNSALQCLVHCEELISYFLCGTYKRDINKQNPIGYNGNVAVTFSSLLEEALTAELPSINPIELRRTIGQYSATFAGLMQQDSQEFLAFLLDALHEDLNRIREKPVTEKPELGEDKSEDTEAMAQLASECWDLHKKRNDSIIVDLFCGLYRSVLVCPDCQRVSITFDPFSDLTLPLPRERSWLKDMIIVPQHGQPKIYEVAMDGQASVRQLKEYIAKQFDMIKNGGADRLIGAEVYSCRVFKRYDNRDRLCDAISGEDLPVVYELDRSVDDLEVFAVPVLHRTTKPKSSDARLPPSTDKGGTIFGIPLYITLTVDESRDLDIIRSKIVQRYVEVRGEPAAEEFDFKMSYFLDNQQSSNANIGASKPLESRMPPKSMLLDDESLAEAEAKAESTVRPVLITPGEAIICDWKQDAVENWTPERLPSADADEVRETAAAKKKKAISLSDCLDLFSKPEVLSQDDLWYCNHCACLRQATKTIELWSIPEIFTIHLKRFSSFRTFRDKIADVVDFPVEGLDLSHRVRRPEGEVIYDLFAVDNHHGGIGGGHYTTLAKNFVDGKWYSYDDTHVYTVEPDKLVTKAAYLLFYRRRSSTALGPPEMQQLVANCRELLSRTDSSGSVFSSISSPRMGALSSIPISPHWHLDEGESADINEEEAEK